MERCFVSPAACSFRVFFSLFPHFLFSSLGEVAQRRAEAEADAEAVAEAGAHMATTTGYLSFGKKNLPSPSIETEISFAIVFLVVKSDARKFRCLKNGPLQRLFSGKHSLALIPLSLIKFASITEQSVFKFAYVDADSIFFFKICWKKLSDVFVF